MRISDWSSDVCSSDLLLLIWLTAYGVTRPLLSVAHMLDAIVQGDGDLTQRLPNDRCDELGQLASGFNRILDQLQPIIRDIQQASQIGSAACRERVCQYV